MSQFVFNNGAANIKARSMWLNNTLDLTSIKDTRQGITGLMGFFDRKYSKKYTASHVARSCTDFWLVLVVRP